MVISNKNSLMAQYVIFFQILHQTKTLALQAQR